MTDFNAIEESRSLSCYVKRGVALVRGEGARVWDDRGAEYIDCVTGHGVANVGHANPRVAEAIAKQSRTLTTCSGVFANDARAKLLEKLFDFVPFAMEKAFLGNSGAEAVEAAIKIARANTGRENFVAAMRAFHGRTMGAVSATHKSDYRDAFAPLVPGFRHAPFNNAEKFVAAIDETVAGVFLEPVQGEGGVRPADEAFVRAVRERCDETGALLIMDEAQTGFGRTGKRFATEYFDVDPDVLLLAKAIGGGVPMGATMVRAGLDLTPGKHGSTFGGNPLACAASLATIDEILERGLDKRAAELGERFDERFDPARHDVVRERRRLGLMIGVELKTKAKPYLEHMATNGVLAMTAGPTVIRMLPPLTIEIEEFDRAIDALDEALREVG
ncbi:MAG: acetylornithine/succinylornithine family transaminase [Ignavibacteriales bacterium]|nr:acetylornithine/succinylornithine family transaminase [Ignavibacteriales bacterium]